MLLDLVLKEKAKAGDGLNFSMPFWNGISLALPQPARRAAKTAKACKEKWTWVYFFSGD